MKNKADKNKQEETTPEDVASEETTNEESPEVEVLEEMPQEDSSPEPSQEASSEDEHQLLRIMAEYDNFRKRTAKEKITLKDDALRATALAFLPVYDNLDRALKQPCSDEAFKKGIEMTMTQMLGVMEKLELEKISAVGELFDPNLHEALTRVDDDRWGENTITDVFTEGFMHRDKVIRFAQVVVAN